MAMTFLHRRPDSGLGNIRSSPSAPTRNIDWVLLFAQSALSVIGLAVIYSASHTKFANPIWLICRLRSNLGTPIDYLPEVSIDVLDPLEQVDATWAASASNKVNCGVWS